MDRAAVWTILADLIPTIAHHFATTKFHAESGSEHLLMLLELIFLGRRHAAFSSVSFCRLQSSEMGFANGPPDNTVRITMTVPTQIQNQPIVSHMFLTFQINTRQSSAASAYAVSEGVILSKAKSFASDRQSLFRSLLLRTTAAATVIARPSDARGLHHVS